MNATSALPRLGQLLAAALILTGSHAFGQVVTTIVGDTETQTYTFTNQGPATIPITFSTLDTSLGASIETVTLQFTGISASGNATVTNLTDNVALGGVPGGYLEDLTGGFTNTYIAKSSIAPTTDQVSTSIISNTQTYTGTPPGSGTSAEQNFTTGTLIATQTTDPQNTVIADTTNYEANGPTTLTITLRAGTTVNASGDTTNYGGQTAIVGGSATALADGTLNLIYTFSGTPVPEPSKTAAIMIGFALCILVGRKYFKGRSLSVA